MDTDIVEKLNILERNILKKELLSLSEHTEEWSGADVIITNKLTKDHLKWLGNDNEIISLQETIPKKRLVITKYSKELSWLFYQLKKIFKSNIDHISKYDFYGILAQTAIDYINKNKRKLNDKILLLYVLDSSRSFNE